jgi:hypothetical protein
MGHALCLLQYLTSVVHLNLNPSPNPKLNPNLNLIPNLNPNLNPNPNINPNPKLNPNPNLNPYPNPKPNPFVVISTWYNGSCAFFYTISNFRGPPK